MAMKPQSNKPRGPVKISQESSPGTTRTANPKRAPVNQSRGPTTGNAGSAAKQRTFLEEKSDRSSYFKQLADMVTRKLTVRGEQHRAYTNPALEPISPNTRVKRGPTRGNQ